MHVQALTGQQGDAYLGYTPERRLLFAHGAVLHVRRARGAVDRLEDQPSLTSPGIPLAPLDVGDAGPPAWLEGRCRGAVSRVARLPAYPHLHGAVLPTAPCCASGLPAYPHLNLPVPCCASCAPGALPAWVPRGAVVGGVSSLPSQLGGSIGEHVDISPIFPA